DGADCPRITRCHAAKSGRSPPSSPRRGAHIIKTADRVMSAIPRLQKAIPPGVDVKIMTDRTQTIRASLEDVQVTMLVTIVLVVVVIFLFLRDLRATIIVGVTVPMSIVGAFVVMYLVGYSVDNLSLMGLTIAVGFVVDDAI